MRKTLKIGALLGCAALLAQGAIAAPVPFVEGDVFVGGSFGVNFGTIQQFTQSGVLKNTLLPGQASEQTGMAFDGDGNLYATSFGASTMTRFSVDDGSIIAPVPFLANDPGSHNESIAFDKSGNFFVGQADGTRDIIKRDATGAFIARYNVATGSRGSDWIDLAADQSTVFYTSEGTTIYRYDTATDTQLADFATPGGQSFALRLLGDGGLLVAHRTDVLRLDSTGAVIQTYDDPDVANFFFALNLDPDGESFWTADYTGGRVYQFNIASGDITEAWTTGGGVSGLAVAGEITEGGPPPPGVPEAGSTLVFLLLSSVATFVGRRFTRA